MWSHFRLTNSSQPAMEKTKENQTMQRSLSSLKFCLWLQSQIIYDGMNDNIYVLKSEQVYIDIFYGIFPKQGARRKERDSKMDV